MLQEAQERLAKMIATAGQISRAQRGLKTLARAQLPVNVGHYQSLANLYLPVGVPDYCHLLGGGVPESFWIILGDGFK
jgi:hypothetical protein